MAEKPYKASPVVWLKVTDYMHDWLQYEYGGARIRNQRVVCVQHLPGAHDIFRMETLQDMKTDGKVGNAMSDRKRGIIVTGLDMDPAATILAYGLTDASMKLFVPVECPSICMTDRGVLRPWASDVSLGKEQASALQRFVRQEFWRAVDTFNLRYAERMDGRKYPQVDMIEAFCMETGTPDLYVDAMRREWQRRVKRGETTAPPPPRKPEFVPIHSL